MTGEVRFCRSTDGTKLAYVMFGSGPPLLVTPHGSLAFRFEAGEALGGPYLRKLGAHHTVICYDARNVGLSAYTGKSSTLDLDVADVGAVLAASGFERVALYGSCQLGPAAAAFAARHPDRVSALVLWATVSNGPAALNSALRNALAAMARSHWPTASRTVADMWAPNSPGPLLEHLARSLRDSLTGEAAAWRMEQNQQTNIVDELVSISARTLVLQRERDRTSPPGEAVRLASVITDSSLVMLAGDAHWQWQGDTAEVVRHVLDFLSQPPSGHAAFEPRGRLSRREREVLSLLGAGLTNRAVADRLGVSVFTVNRHVSSILAKLGASNRAEAVRRGAERGLWP